jgi:hypothetical protein
VGAYLQYNVCMKDSFARVMIFSNGSMFMRSKRGAVCAL